MAQADGVLRGGADAGAAPDVEAEVVVVAAGADEGGAAEVRLDLEAERVAVEREAALDVADVEVQVAHAQAFADGCAVGSSPSIVASRARKSSGGGAAGVAEVDRPVLAGAVGGELDAVAVGVREVDRLVGAVVGGAVDRRLGDAQAHGGAGELLAARVQQRVVVEAGVAARGAGERVLVEDHGGGRAVAELGGGRLVGVDAQAEGALVPGDRAVEVARR